MSLVAVVTGANKGIGYQIALQLALNSKFSAVILGCRDNERGLEALNQMKQELIGSSSSCGLDFHMLTVGNAESETNFFKYVDTKYSKVDVLVNNAGIAYKGSDPTPHSQQCTPTLDTNFRGLISFTEIMMPLIQKGNDRRIINVASMAGKLSQLQSTTLQNKFSDPLLTKNELIKMMNQFEADVHNGEHLENGWSNSNYGMSKLAVIAYTKVLAREHETIKINCCCPGYCDTDMTSHKGTRSPQDGAKNATLLATMDDAPTGQFFKDLKPAEW